MKKIVTYLVSLVLIACASPPKPPISINASQGKCPEVNFPAQLLENAPCQLIIAKFKIDENGSPFDTKLSGWCGDNPNAPIIENAILKTVSQCHFPRGQANQPRYSEIIMSFPQVVKVGDTYALPPKTTTPDNANKPNIGKYCPQPKYPEELRKDEIIAAGSYQATIDKHGKVIDVQTKVNGGLGKGQFFAQAVVTALLGCQLNMTDPAQKAMYYGQKVTGNYVFEPD